MSEMQRRLIFQKDLEGGKTIDDIRREEAYKSFRETKARYGEKDLRTQSKFFVYYLRGCVAMIKSYVEATKEMLSEISEISEVVDSLVEMEIGGVDRFMQGIEKWPRFMRGFVVRRRANRYYKDKMQMIQTKVEVVLDMIKIVPQITTGVMKSMTKTLGGISASFDIPGAEHSGVLLPEMEADYEAQKNGVPPAAPSDPSTPAQPTAPSSDPSAPAGDGGDHWGDDIL